MRVEGGGATRQPLTPIGATQPRLPLVHLLASPLSSIYCCSCWCWSLRSVLLFWGMLWEGSRIDSFLLTVGEHTRACPHALHAVCGLDVGSLAAATTTTPPSASSTFAPPPPPPPRLHHNVAEKAEKGGSSSSCSSSVWCSFTVPGRRRGGVRGGWEGTHTHTQTCVCVRVRVHGL